MVWSFRHCIRKRTHIPLDIVHRLCETIVLYTSIYFCTIFSTKLETAYMCAYVVADQTTMTTSIFIFPFTFTFTLNVEHSELFACLFVCLIVCTRHTHFSYMNTSLCMYVVVSMWFNVIPVTGTSATK